MTDPSGTEPSSNKDGAPLATRASRQPPARRRLAPLVIAIAVVLGLLGGGIGIGIGLSGGSSGASGRAAPVASASATGPARVLLVLATPTSPIEVDLAWKALGPVDMFSIFRNGRLLSTSPANITVFTDGSATPDRTYMYAISATDPAGHVSPQVTATATTPAPPPLSEARLTGEFLVKAKFVAENYTNFSVGQTERLTWRFQPQCDSGACDTTVDIFAPGERLKALAHDGTTYATTGTARLGTCASSTLTTTVTIRVRVTGGQYVGDEWTATSFAGTLKEYSPPTFSCQAGSSTERLRGSFRGL